MLGGVQDVQAVSPAVPGALQAAGLAASPGAGLADQPGPAGSGQLPLCPRCCCSFRPGLGQRPHHQPLQVKPNLPWGG